MASGLEYQSAIDVLTSQGKFYINLGLERVQKTLDLLDNPQNKLKFIHVAGTNGKGSVCAMLSAILRRSKKVGLFTSPHVFEYTERIKINDIEIEKDDFAQGIIDIVELADKNGIHLTEFEILAVLAFKYFAENNVDIVILETGLGGRLDATNVIKENICSVITHIDLDHTERLGDTIEKIAYEKAGIIKKNCPVVVSKSNAGFEVIKEVADEMGSELCLVGNNLCHCEALSEAIQEKSFLDCRVASEEAPRKDENIYYNNLSLKGTYQRENLALVLKVVDILNENGFEISESAAEEGLQNVSHPCRFQYLENENIIIDGAHNPSGAKLLRESLDFYYPNQTFRFIFGCLKNKEYPQMMENLFTPKDEIYFYSFDNPNSCSIEELSQSCRFESKTFEQYLVDKTTLTVVCGSFYMIKELLQKMGIK